MTSSVAPALSASVVSAPAVSGPVLVVDDDMVSRLVLAHMLRRFGFDVVEADDLAPAIDLVGESRFALVFCDYSMPGGTGLELFARLRLAAERPQFVLVTGIVDDPETGSERFVSVDAYLTKPVSTRALRTCMKIVLPQWELRS